MTFRFADLAKGPLAGTIAVLAASLMLLVATSPVAAGELSGSAVNPPAPAAWHVHAA